MGSSLLAVAMAAMYGLCRAQEGMTDQLRTAVLDGHNTMRRTIQAANMARVEYDLALECVARTYIERSQSFTGHNQNADNDYATCGGSGSVGENWFSGPPQAAAWAWVDAKWPWNDEVNGCSERENWAATHADRNAVETDEEYNRAIDNCSNDGVTGHFTQVMWANTTKVGCWYEETFGTLCNYSPPGNVYYDGLLMDFAAYGTPCSMCNTGLDVCDDGLCARAAGGAVDPATPGAAMAAPFEATTGAVGTEEGTVSTGSLETTAEIVDRSTESSVTEEPTETPTETPVEKDSAGVATGPSGLLLAVALTTALMLLRTAGVA